MNSGEKGTQSALGWELFPAVSPHGGDGLGEFVGLSTLDADPELLGSGSIGIAKQLYPWETVADWTHSLPKTTTGQWMDALGRDQFYHRWKGHHLVSDGWTALNDANLSFKDFVVHLGTDVITIHGVPILPDTAVQFLSNSLGKSVHEVAPWVLNNVFDLSIGMISAGGAAHDVMLAFTGGMQWGTQTAIFTFGTGTAEIATGLASSNPLLIGAGVGEFAAGGKCAWDYYSQPFLFGVPISDLISGLGIGGAGGLLCSAVSVASGWKQQTTSEKIRNSVGITSTGALLGLLASISPWLSIPAGGGLTVCKLAGRLAREQDLADSLNRLGGDQSIADGIRNLIDVTGIDATLDFVRYLKGKPEAKDVNRYLTDLKSNVNSIIENRT